MSWREKVSREIKNHLELQIKKAHKHKISYRTASEPSKAQLWIAIANLSEEIHNLNKRMNELEKELYNASLPETKKKRKKAEELIESISQL